MMIDPVRYENTVEEIRELLEQEQFADAAGIVRELHPADAAEVLAELDAHEQAGIVQLLETEHIADVFEQMYEEDMAEVAEHLDKEMLVDVLDEMEPDTAADLLGELEPAEAAELIGEMDDAEQVVSLMKYAEDSAGGIMNTPPPSLRRWMKVREAVTFLREHYQDAEDIYYLYVLDRNANLIGLVNLRAMVLADPEATIESIMRRDIVSVHVDADQEEAAHLLARYDLLAVPVVDADERLVGIITVDDLMDVVEEEATEDIYRLAQVGSDSALFSPIRHSLRSRLPWLMLNTFTAFIASSMVALFEPTIAKVTILAAFLPIVAGQGGNAGTQTMTVVVRSLALREVEPRDTRAALSHEMRLGLVNGLVLGTGVALITWLITRNAGIGLAIGLAMLCNMIVASTFGTLVPMTLRVLRIDPALASSIFVTAATDTLGFFLFLGISTLLMNLILAGPL